MKTASKIFDPFSAVEDATSRGRAIIREMAAFQSPTSEQAREFANESEGARLGREHAIEELARKAR